MNFSLKVNYQHVAYWFNCLISIGSVSGSGVDSHSYLWYRIINGISEFLLAYFTSEYPMPLNDPRLLLNCVDQQDHETSNCLSWLPNRCSAGCIWPKYSRRVQIKCLDPVALQLWVALHGRMCPEVTCVENSLTIWQQQQQHG